MSVAFVMDSYTLRLGFGHHHHHHHPRMLSPESSHVTPHQDRQPDRPQDSQLRFSVVNILRPEFGREAILSTKVTKSSGHVTAAVPVQLPRHSPLPLPRDLSLSSTRLSPQSPQSSTTYSVQRDGFSSHCGLTSPLQRHNGLSRSGSLESLASSRSSVASSSVTSPPSLCSASSTIGTESLNSDNASGTAAAANTAQASQQNGTNAQSLWPAWVYCTRYSDRPSSGKRDSSYASFLLDNVRNLERNRLAIIAVTAGRPVASILRRI